MKCEEDYSLKRKSEQDSLTSKERAVVYCLAEGLSNQEIAEKLHVSIHTVKAHLESIYEKLEVENRLQAVMRALILGYIALNEISIKHADVNKKYE